MQGETARDFGGPVGNLFLIFGLPALTAYLYFGLAFNQQNLLPSTQSDWAGFCRAMMPTWEAAGHEPLLNCGSVQRGTALGSPMPEPPEASIKISTPSRHSRTRSIIVSL